MLPYVRESRTHFACCSITIRAQRVKSRRVFDLKFTHEPAIARAKFYAMENNANGRTAEKPRTPTTERTLTFSSTWRFRVDTCKSLASTYIYCVFVNQVCTMKIFLLFSSSTTVNNSYYYTGFPTCCE